jgi:hypothetical protein
MHCKCPLSLLFFSVQTTTCHSPPLCDFLQFHNSEFTQDIGVNTDYSNIEEDSYQTIKKNPLGVPQEER